MNQLWHDTGISALLESYFNKVQPVGGNNLTLRLFSNSFTPVSGNVASAFTEVTGGGYAAKTLAAGSWTVSVVGGIPQVVFAKQVFTFTGTIGGSGQVYGHYVTDADGDVIYSQLESGPWTPLLNGDHFDVTPKTQGSYGTPTTEA
ncbi:MAG: hypothetical protein AB9919_06960 [Geobacteraceae bacterium]